jgi:hypothetical protein
MRELLFKLTVHSRQISTIFFAGIHLGWRLFIVGIFLGVALIGATYLEEFVRVYRIFKMGRDDRSKGSCFRLTVKQRGVDTISGNGNPQSAVVVGQPSGNIAGIFSHHFYFFFRYRSFFQGYGECKKNDVDPVLPVGHQIQTALIRTLPE